MKIQTLLPNCCALALLGQVNAAQNIPLGNPTSGALFGGLAADRALNDTFPYDPDVDYSDWANIAEEELPDTTQAGIYHSTNSDLENFWGADVDLIANAPLDFLDIWGRSDYGGAPEPDSEKSRHQGLTISFFDAAGGMGNLLGEVMAYNGITAREGDPGTAHTPGSAFGRFDVALAVPDEEDRKLIQSVVIGQDAGDADYFVLAEVRAGTNSTEFSDPKLVAPAEMAVGPVDYQAGAISDSFSISNAAESTNALTISSVVPSGEGAANFIVTAFPASLAPGESGLVEFSFDPLGIFASQTSDFVITSNDEFTPETSVSVSGSVTASAPDTLEFLGDPVTCSASSEFNGAFVVTNLFDQAPTPADIENAAFDGGGQFAGIGSSPHVIVCDYGATVSFDSFVYAQRLGGNPELDKVPGLDIWVSETDPGLATLALPILSEAPSAVITGITTTDSFLRFYPLQTNLSGRYVVIRMHEGNGNTGGSELQLAMAGPAERLAIQTIDYLDGDVTLSWKSQPTQFYTLRRSTDLSMPIEDWILVDDNIQAGGETTTFIDSSLLPGQPKMFYRLLQN